MKRIFLPAIALMHRLHFTRKFLVLGAIFLVAIAEVAYGLAVYVVPAIQTSQRELDGLTLIVPISEAVQLLQRHRGLSSGALGGDSAMRNSLAANEGELDAIIAALDGRLPADGLLQNSWAAFRGDWASLKADYFRTSMDESFKRHTGLIEELQRFKVHVADLHALSTEPDIATHYLLDAAIVELPSALEHLAKIRGLGAGLLARKQMADEQHFAMRSLIVELRSSLKTVSAGLEKTALYNPQVAPEIAATAANLASSANRVVGLVDAHILSSRFDASPEAYFKAITLEIDGSRKQLHQILLPTAEALIEGHIRQIRLELALRIGAALLLLLVSYYLFAGIYYSTVDTIESLRSSAGQIVAGDLGHRIALETRDELRHVGDLFNGMAEGFHSLLLKRLEDGERLRAILEGALDAVIQIDIHGRITGWNSQAQAMFGWSAEEVMGLPLHEYIIPDRHRDAHQRGMARYLASGEGPILRRRIEIEALRRSGQEFPVELTIAPIKVEGQVEFNAFISDISERKKAEETIYDLAYRDPVSHLPNRRLLRDRLQQALLAAGRSKRYSAILAIGLDHVGILNDTLGREVGNQLIREVAECLRANMHGEDTVAHLGGDKFAVVLGALDGDEEASARLARAVADRVLALIGRPFDLQGHEHHGACCVGVVLFASSDGDSDELLKRAEAALNQAREAGRGEIRFFDRGIQAELESRVELEARMRRGLEGQFRLYYQAQVDHQGLVFGAEALIRWQDPERGLVSPAAFIPVAEETGMILAIGDWVVRAACAQLQQWAGDARTRQLIVAINVSARQFHQPDFVDKLLAQVDGSGIAPDRLKIELTESLLVKDVEGIITKMSALRARGVRLSLDDFGTGFSSLTYLQRLPLNQLKIDQAFVRNALAKRSDAAIVRTVIALGQSLGLDVIAEGVETQEQRDFLAAHGCLSYQGYLYSKPLPVEQFEAFLHRTNSARGAPA